MIATAAVEILDDDLCIPDFYVEVAHHHQLFPGATTLKKLEIVATFKACINSLHLIVISASDTEPTPQ